jgi:hypothetical protein
MDKEALLTMALALVVFSPFIYIIFKLAGFTLKDWVKYFPYKELALSIICTYIFMQWLSYIKSLK